MSSIDAAAVTPVPESAASDDPRRELMVGGAIAGLFFVIFLGWAAITPLDAAAYASGVIAVSGNRQAVQHRDGGVVTALHVVEGETVTKGEVVVEISATEIKAAERGLAGQVLSLLAQRARLIAERDHQANFADPAEFAKLSAEDRPIAAEALRLQRAQFAARRDSIVTQRAVLNQRILQLDEQTTGLTRQLAANTEQQRLIEEELKGMKSLAAQGYAPMTRVRELERSAAQLTGEDGNYRAQIARSGEAVGETRMQSMSLDRQMMEEVSGQLRDVQVQLDELQPKLSAAREQVARAVVRAPTSGKVVGLSIFTVGGVVSPGQSLMDIVPQDRALVIQAMVNPNDADDLTIGQVTQVRFSTLHERDLPILTGKLTKMSADSFLDEKSGQRYFKAEVSVPEDQMAKIVAVRGAHTGVQAGLPVEVMVPLRKRTALQYLFEPLFQTFWKTGREH